MLDAMCDERSTHVRMLALALAILALFAGSCGDDADSGDDMEQQDTDQSDADDGTDEVGAHNDPGVTIDDAGDLQCSEITGMDTAEFADLTIEPYTCVDDGEVKPIGTPARMNCVDGTRLFQIWPDLEGEEPGWWGYMPGTLQLGAASPEAIDDCSGQ